MVLHQEQKWINNDHAGLELPKTLMNKLQENKRLKQIGPILLRWTVEKSNQATTLTQT
jgi:hypothetical protein